MPRMNYIANFYCNAGDSYPADFERFSEWLPTVIENLRQLFSAHYGLAELFYRRPAMNGEYGHIRIYRTSDHIHEDATPAIDMPMMEFFKTYNIPTED